MPAPKFGVSTLPVLAPNRTSFKSVVCLPRPVLSLLRGIGVNREGADQRGGAALASYLLFEAGYTRELMRLGASDTLARRDEVLAFFGWPQRALADAARDASPTAWSELELRL